MIENMSLPPYPDDKMCCSKCNTTKVDTWIASEDAVTEWYCRGGKRPRYWFFGEMVTECSQGVVGEHMHFMCDWCGAHYCTQTADGSKENKQ